MWLARRYRSKSISTSLVGAKSACPPSDGIGRYRAPSQNRIASPSPVPAAISAMALLAEEGAPAFKTSVSSGLRTGTQCAAASTSFSRRTVGSSKRFELPTVRLLNDVEAAAHWVPVLRPDETEVLNAGAPSSAKSAMALIAAGTGLGEAILFWDGARYRPMPSEGGHADFAPTSDVEIDLLRYLRASHMHVSYERVLTGAGLHAVYEFIRDTKKNEPTWLAERLKVGDPAAIIAELGLSGKAEICVQALDLFASVYGAEAGNLALKALALDGVFLGGGIAPKLLAKLKDATFMRAFVSKGRYKRLMSTIPVRVILNQKTALLGAASVAARLRAEA